MNYVPINCNTYDELILLIQQKLPVTILSENEDGCQEQHQSIIVDIYTRSKAEFICLEGGKEIRLDYLVEVGGLKIRGKHLSK